MARPVKKAAKPPPKKPSRLRQAARQVAVDADEVRHDLNKLLLSLEVLSVEALREISNRALELIEVKAGGHKRSFIGGMVGGAMSIGESITGLFGRSEDEPAPRKRRARRARRAEAE
jgi:hypothetical protein